MPAQPKEGEAAALSAAVAGALLPHLKEKDTTALSAAVVVAPGTIAGALLPLLPYLKEGDEATTAGALNPVPSASSMLNDSDTQAPFVAVASC